MFTLGILSILQIIFLPGYIAIRLYKYRCSFIGSIVISFALSLIINHILILLLTSISIYNSSTIYTIFTCELILLLLLLISPKFNKPITNTANAYGFNDICSGPTSINVTKIVMHILAGIALVYFSYQMIRSFGQIFNLWDDVTSWNRWAVHWSNNHFPKRTWHYPQLLPSNISLTYVFMGEPKIQMFAKAIMPLFSILIILSLFDLWQHTRQFGYTVAITTTFALLLICNGLKGISSGYADIPVTLLAFISIYLLLLNDNSGSFEDTKKNIYLGSICCAGAALTKQAGLFVSVVYPVLCYFMVLRDLTLIDHLVKKKIIINVTVLLIVIIAPWYAFTEYRIHNGQDQSEVSFVLNTVPTHLKVTDRLSYSVDKIKIGIDDLLNEEFPNIKPKANLIRAFNNIFLLLLTLLSIFGAKNTPLRSVMVAIVLPYFFLWAFLYSYDLRNLTLITPFLGVLVGFGSVACHRYIDDHNSLAILPKVEIQSFYKIKHYLQYSFQESPFLKTYVLIIFTVVAISVPCIFVTDEDLISKQDEMAKLLVNPELNKIVYANVGDSNSVRMLSNYSVLYHLPGLSTKTVYNMMVELDNFKSAIAKTKPSFVLIIKTEVIPSKDIYRYLSKHVEAKRMTVIKESNCYYFLKVGDQFYEDNRFDTRI